MQISTLNPHELVTGLPLTIDIWFVSLLSGTRRNLLMFDQGILGRIGLVKIGTGVFG